MKKLILSELLLLFLATTFISDNPNPGWVQQTLPVSDLITDIFFLDSLTGWLTTQGGNNDTSRIMKTTNGGLNWTIQNDSMFNIAVIQFVNFNTGYAGGGNGRAKFLKTTNGGNLWIVTTPFGSSISDVSDIFYVNKDTGWFCSDDPFGGGIYKTTTGGTNWFPQLGAGFRPKKLFFINSDTGWVISNEANSKLYRTTNSGQVWNLIFTYNTNPASFFFISGMIGWTGGAGTGNGIQYTTDGGYNWVNSQGYTGGGYDVKFINDSIGYTGRVPQVLKSTDGGKTWGYQNTPLNTYQSIAVIKNDTSLAWAGYFSLIHTSDGGGNIVYLGINKIGNELPSTFKLYQNYPNPFNPKTNIKYDVKRQTSNVKLIVYDIQGKLITELVNQKQNAGTYEVDFDGSGLSSGVYFYKIIIAAGKEVFSDVKKMILLK